MATDWDAYAGGFAEVFYGLTDQVGAVQLWLMQSTERNDHSGVISKTNNYKV